MEINLFKSTVARIMEPKLSAFNYKMDFNPPGSDEDGSIWFEKKLQEGIYLVIGFQPSFLAPNDIDRFTVNLGRNSPTYEAYRQREILPGYLLNERLASYIWIENRHDPEWKSDNWWRCRNEQELEIGCRDVLDKLFQYGIPFLEDLNSKSPIFHR